MNDPHNPSHNKGMTYEQAGVSIAAGNALVKAIAPLVKATARPARIAILAVLAGCLI